MALNTYSTLSRYPLNIIRGTRRGPDSERATFTVGATADKNVPKYIIDCFKLIIADLSNNFLYGLTKSQSRLCD